MIQQAYQLALRELNTDASTALQGLKRTSHFLRLAPCPDIRVEL